LDSVPHDAFFQATLKEPPKAVVSMRKTIIVSYASTGTYYCLIAFLGYAALGSGVPGDVLTGFSVSKAVEVLANAAVLGHMLAAVQVYMHPIYEVRMSNT
jgi:amino acid permease